MKQYYESEVLYKLMERDGFNIPSSVPPYESEIKAYLINQVKQAYPKLTDYEAEWLLYNYTKHLPADFPISSVIDATTATFENVVPFAYQSAILTGSTKYRDIDTGEILETFEEGRNLELVSVKMPVLTTTGKNLFDEKQPPEETHLGNNVRRVNVEENTTYVYSSSPYTGSVSIEFYNNSDNKIGGVSIPSGTSFTTPPNTSYLKTHTDNDSLVQIEEGSATTSYEPYKSNILSTPKDLELRGIGNVKDELDCLTGEVTERISEIVLNGNEAWSYGSGNSTETIALFYTNLDHNVEYKPNINDKLPSIEGFSTNFGEGIYIDSDINVRINRNKLNGSTVNDFKQWLSQNPITLQYKLATESVKKVDLTTVNEKGESVYFMPLEGTMNVQSTGEIIQPTFDMTVPVEATKQNLASFINLEMEE